MESFKEDHLHIKLWRVILTLAVINSVILLLKYLNLNTYVIIIGFRCHISFVLPFFLIFNSDFLPFIKRSFLNPDYKKASVFLVLMILPFLIEMGYLYFTHNIDLGDPDYFYEFGVSSVLDYPVYLIWNFPQIILLYLFLAGVSTISKYRFITVFLSIIFLFVSELIPVNHAPFPYSEMTILFACSVMFSVLINYYRNIYWFCISVFTLLWLPVLSFGTGSKAIVNLLFASQYKYWDGFFEVQKIYAPFALPVYFVLALIISLFFYLLKFKKGTAFPSQNEKTAQKIQTPNTSP